MTPSIADIVQAVSAHYSLFPEQIMGRRAARRYAYPRQIVMFLARDLTGLSYPQIGAKLYRDHTTIMFGNRKLRKIIAETGEPAEITACRELSLRVFSLRYARMKADLSQPLWTDAA